jgi:orotate phosphoribosyltransferase
MTNRNHLLARLASAYDYREEPFRLSSGQESHEYLDCRAALSDPATLQLAAQAMLDLLDPGVQAVGGLTMGADPLAVALSLSSGQKFREGVRWFSIRKEVKQHGTGRLIEGYAKTGARVAVLEDVSTTGGSALKAVLACAEADLEIVQVMPLVDRGGCERIKISLVASEQYAPHGIDAKITPVLPFADIAVVGRAQKIAIEAHGDQRYGDRETGPLYSASHLPAVVDVIAEMTDYEPHLMAGAWIHDALEDTSESVDSLREKLPEFVVALADACTDGQGANRRERKQRPMRLIPTVPNSVLIKLSDRIANVENARREGKDSLLGLYRKEQRDFYEQLKGAPVGPGLDAAPFWARLSRALVSAT